MMKRIALLSVLSVYFLLTAGIQLHLHYCCGHLADFHFITTQHCESAHEKEHGDTCCGKKECCAYVHIDLKVEDSHEPSETARFIPLGIFEDTIFTFQSAECCASQVVVGFKPTAPPPDNKRYLKHRSLVLYA